MRYVLTSFLALGAAAASSFAADDAARIRDLERRLEQHRQGQVPCHTRGRLPVVLVYSQETTTRVEALSAERRLKGWSRAKKEALVRGDWGSVRKLARGRHRPARR